jgi:hypothetical protein
MLPFHSICFLHVALNGNLIHFAACNTYTLPQHGISEEFRVIRGMSMTYWNYPVTTGAVGPSPRKVPDFRLAAFVGTEKLAGNLPGLEERCHPVHLYGH